ncbi:MAG TPA: methyltransferase domain-containing protein [Candidatus Acidoferrum sp.]
MRSSKMQEHYAAVQEAERLSAGIGELERLRTQDVLGRHLPKAPARILDVGGAAGVHALWLARQGYEVHLSDPVPRHVEEAKDASRAQARFPIASCTVGDARRIEQKDASSDGVLLLGPLYHLTEGADRLKALRETHRVLRAGGRVFAAAISRFASFMDGFSRDFVGDPRFVEILRQDLKDGQHRNPTDNPHYFTSTFFHHADELRSEIEEAGFTFEKIIAVEGPVWVMGNFANHWNDPKKRALLLEFLRTIEEERTLLGATAHMIAIGKKTTRGRSDRDGKSDQKSSNRKSSRSKSAAEGTGPSSILADALKMTGFLFCAPAERSDEPSATSAREERSTAARFRRRCCSGRCRHEAGHLSLPRRAVR